jgi:hypothetical protein
VPVRVRFLFTTGPGPESGDSKPSIGWAQMALVKSGIDAAVCGAAPSAPPESVGACARAGNAAAEAAVADETNAKMKLRHFKGMCLSLIRCPLPGSRLLWLRMFRLSKVRLVSHRDRWVFFSTVFVRIFSTDIFRPVAEYTPIGLGSRPNRREDAFVLDRELKL